MIYLLIIFDLILYILAPVTFIICVAGLYSYASTRTRHSALSPLLRVSPPLWGLVWGVISALFLWKMFPVYSLSFPLLGLGVGANTVSNIAERAAEKLPGEDLLEGEKLKLFIVWLFSLLLLLALILFRTILWR